VPAGADEQPGQPERGDGGDGEEDGVEDVVDAPGAGVDLRHLGRAVPVDGRRRRTGASHLGCRHGITLSNDPPTALDVDGEAEENYRLTYDLPRVIAAGVKEGETIKPLTEEAYAKQQEAIKQQMMGKGASAEKH